MAFSAPLLPALGTFLGGSTGISALGLAGGALGAINSIQQSKYQAAVARNNALIAEQNAARRSEAAQLEAQRSDINFAALMAEQLATQGASGFDILGRSQTQARMLTRRTRGQEATDIRRAGEADAGQMMQDAVNFRGEAKQAVRQGYINAAGQLISTGTDLMKSGTLITRARKKMPWDRRSM